MTKEEGEVVERGTRGTKVFIFSLMMFTILINDLNIAVTIW